MARNLTRKRPCCICRKWFLPNVRQKGRQKTCSPECSNELHRRQCKKWNKANKSYFKDEYLSKKLEKANDRQAIPSSPKTTIPPQVKPVLPTEIIVSEYGPRSAIIIQYLAFQITRCPHETATGFS